MRLTVILDEMVPPPNLNFEGMETVMNAQPDRDDVIAVFKCSEAKKIDWHWADMEPIKWGVCPTGDHNVLYVPSTQDLPGVIAEQMEELENDTTDIPS